MRMHVELRNHRGATVLAIVGTVDADGLRALRQPVAAATLGGDLVVIDLDRAELVDPVGLRALVTDVVGAGAGPRLRLVTRRNTTTALLARGRIHHLVAVHPSVEDAVAAHRLLVRRRRRSPWPSVDLRLLRVLARRRGPSLPVGWTTGRR